MRVKKKVLFLLISFCSSTIYCTSWSSIGSRFTSIGDGISKTGQGIINGFKAMGGKVPPGYDYYFMVFNGLQENVTVQIDKDKKVMGERFSSGTGTTASITPGGNSGSTFSNIGLYFSISIPSCGYTEDHYTLGQKHDKTVYSYHTFQNSDGSNGAEKIGVVATTADFSGMIYNGSGSASTVTFPWNGKSVTVPVESGSFNGLSSTSKNVLRPSTLKLGSTNIAVGAQGLGSKVKSGTGSTAKATVLPTRYNYEIISGGGGIETGIAPGNFKQPGSEIVSGSSSVSGAVPITLYASTSYGNTSQESVVPAPANIRDITPMECNIWNQPGGSSSTVSKNPIGLNFPWQPLWFAYTGEAINSDGTLVESPIGIIPAGKCLSLSLLRPSVSEKVAKLYLVLLNTTDQSEAQSFFNVLLKTTLPSYDVKTPAAALTAQQKNTLLDSKLDDDVGYLYANNLTGIIVGMDIFTSYGMASSGPYYYMVSPPMLSLGNVMSTFTQSLTNLTSTSQTALWTNLQKWAQNYNSNPTAVRQEVETFLIQNGPPSMVTKTGNAGSLNKAGLAFLSTVLYGPTSVTKMPIWYNMAAATSLTTPSTWVKSADIITI